MYLERAQAARLRELMGFFPAVVVTGARQVGKSTMIQHTLAAHADIVVFDPVLDVENARREPDLFLDNHRRPLVLDEIQYAPELVASLKRRIDKDRTPGQYVLTGSQQWGVLASVSESLAGRAVFLDLEGFSLAELARNAGTSWLQAWLDGAAEPQAPSLNRLKLDRPLFEQLWRGFLPEAQFLPAAHVPVFLTAYLRTYVERDVRTLADVSDWQLFGRFVRLAAALTAQEVKFAHLGRELGLNPETSKRWLAMLTATFQWHEVPGYSGNLAKRVSLKPKGYFADTGLACLAQAISTPAAVASHPSWGALFETAIVAEIRKACALMSPSPNLYHWRSHGGAEVDLLLERDGKFHPIEVKGTSHPSRSDTSGIAAFRKAHPGLRIGQGLVIAPVERSYPLSEQDWAFPWDACV
ncbi:MAG: ATP-binding protein [Candidatus Wallbacteria bacterium]|nr:ATP-binding protein [Candidatus Wallbacteria bacterium]